VAGRLSPALAPVLLAAVAWVVPACAATPNRKPAPVAGEDAAPPPADTPPDLPSGNVETPLSPVAGRDLTRLDGAIQRFAQSRAGRLPTSLRELTTEKSPDGIPYLRTVPTDPWGRPYGYAVLSVRQGSYDLRSYGPDRTAGTPDDVVARADPVRTH